MAALLYGSGVVALILLSLFIYFFWPTFDADMAGWIRQDRGPGFSALMGFISWWGVSYVMIGSVFVAALLFFVTSWKREAWFTLIVFVTDIINILLKLIINRHRPGEVEIFPKFQRACCPLCGVLRVHPGRHAVQSAYQSDGEVDCWVFVRVPDRGRFCRSDLFWYALGF